MMELNVTTEAVDRLLHFKLNSSILYASGETPSRQAVRLCINGIGQFVITIDGNIYGQSYNPAIIISEYNEIVKPKHRLTGE